MRIFTQTSPQQEFMLSPGFTADMSRTNPFLTDTGSQSIPLTLPASEHNMKIIGYLYRGQSTNRFQKRHDVIMHHGSVNMSGVLIIDSAHQADGIDCTFYTNEGQLYEKMNGVKMGDISWPKRTYSGVDIIVVILKLIMREEANEDFHVFPVKTSNELKRSDYEQEDMTFILNETISVSQTPSEVKFVGEEPRNYVTITDGTENTIELPVGYGITPFLKLSVVLRNIMKEFGYTLNSNIFDTHNSLRRIVLINNTADAICGGFIDYSQLIPGDIEVMDLINIVRTNFGVEFVERGQKIDIVTWNEAITSNADKDLTKYIAGRTRIELIEPSNLNITMDRSLTPYASVEKNSREELSAKYGPIKNVLNTSETTTQTLNYWPYSGRYMIVEANWEERPVFTYKYVSSSFWDKKGDTTIDIEDIQLKNISVPMANSGSTINLGKSQSFTLPYIGNLRNMNTYLSITNDGKIEEEEETVLSPMLCFSVPGWQRNGPYGDATNIYYQLFKMGSCFNYDRAGNKWGEMNLIFTGDDNLYDAFYTYRDRMLKYANQVRIIPMNLPLEEIEGMDLSKPKIIDGEKVLIEKIDFVFGKPEICEVTARTLHKYPE